MRLRPAPERKPDVKVMKRAWCRNGAEKSLLICQKACFKVVFGMYHTDLYSAGCGFGSRRGYLPGKFGVVRKPRGSPGLFWWGANFALEVRVLILFRKIG